MRTRRLLTNFSAAFLLAAAFTVLASSGDCTSENCDIWNPWDPYWWWLRCYLPPCEALLTRAWYAIVAVL